MQRTGRNQGRYQGETILIEEALRTSTATAERQGFSVETLRAEGTDLVVYQRPPATVREWSPRIYLSAGIHGDEPAGPLAVGELLRAEAFPRDAWLWILPCLNPTGFPANTRESAAGIDLNRDYKHLRAPEIRAHVAWLQRQPMFDLAFCLHEDWEAAGFYVYELNPDQRPSLAEPIIAGARTACPIDLSPSIDGREAQGGIIRPSIDPATRAEWPEAFYLLQHKTRLSYTVESPSDFELPVRVAALVAGVGEALRQYARTHCGQVRLDPSAPPR